MTRTEIKRIAKEEAISQLYNCIEFGHEMIQNTNGIVDSEGNFTERYTKDQVDEIARELAKQAERAITFLER